MKPLLCSSLKVPVTSSLLGLDVLPSTILQHPHSMFFPNFKDYILQLHNFFGTRKVNDSVMNHRNLICSVPFSFVPFNVNDDAFFFLSTK